LESAIVSKVREERKKRGSIQCDSECRPTGYSESVFQLLESCRAHKLAKMAQSFSDKR